MKNARIFDGDYVIIKQQSTAENDDIVAARLNDEVTVKYFKKVKDTIILKPANPDFNPITIKKEDEFSILGIVVLTIRPTDEKKFRALISKN